MSSSTVSQSATPEFTPQAVGGASYVTRHSTQMFEEGRSFSGNERFKLFFGVGDAVFEDHSALGGADSNLDGRAILAVDFDDDGDEDLFIHNIQRERHLLFENLLGGRGNGFLKLRLRATAGQYEAIGATVTVKAGGRSVAQVLSRGAGFASCQAPELVFGLGAAESATVSVAWPGGFREDFGEVRAGARLLLVEGVGKPEPFAARTRSLPDPLPEGLAVRVGERVPVLRLVDGDGVETEVDVRALADGRPMLVNLWGRFCAPCIAELPTLARIHADGERRVLLLGTDAPGGRAAAANVLAKRAPGIPAYYLRAGGEGLEPLVDLVRLPIPTTLVLDAEGVVREIIRGPVEPE